eukprot:gene51153-68477_t
MADTFWPLSTILSRLLVAVILGGIIGFEREASAHSAGLRTHILISLAAALYTILTLEIFHLPDVMTQGRSDPVHAVEAVTAGIAFLGAGAIFRRGGGPRGLTAGAGMWLAGAVGLSCGFGLWQIAGLGTFLILVVMGLLHSLEVKLGIAADKQEHREPSKTAKAGKDDHDDSVFPCGGPDVAARPRARHGADPAPPQALEQLEQQYGEGLQSAEISQRFRAALASAAQT